MPLNQACKVFTHFFNGLLICLKLCIYVLTQASASSWVSLKLISSTGPGCSGEASTRVECPSFLPIISLGCFLSFYICHCLNCNTFLNRYSSQCNAVKSPPESFILHCYSWLIAHRALQLSRVLTPGLWTRLGFFYQLYYQLVWGYSL